MSEITTRLRQNKARKGDKKNQNETFQPGIPAQGEGEEREWGKNLMVIVEIFSFFRNSCQQRKMRKTTSLLHIANLICFFKGLVHAVHAIHFYLLHAMHDIAA